MMFNVLADEGNRIVGVLIPDGFSGSLSIRVSDGRRDLLVLPCEEEHRVLVEAGRHATGRCGFIIDESTVADLSKQGNLEIYDYETNILIYRRRPPSQITKKRIFRLETHLFPLWRLDDRFDRHFQFFYKGIERHGRETATQLFRLNNSGSLYLSGRLIFKSYEICFDDTYNCVALLRDPYAELAETLLTLKHMRGFGKELLGERDLMAYGPAIAFAETLETDEKSLHRAFATMPRPVIANLRNPLTRQLTARTADEVPSKGAIAAALETLSSFTILGLREHQDFFLAQLADLVGTSAETLRRVPEFVKTGELAEQLRHVPEAALLIEQDLELYHHIKSAIENALVDEAP